MTGLGRGWRGMSEMWSGVCTYTKTRLVGPRIGVGEVHTTWVLDIVVVDTTNNVTKGPCRSSDDTETPPDPWG